MSAFDGAYDGVNTNTLILIVAVVGYVVKTVGEGKGWFKTAATLRVENTDLLRRNSELDASVERLEETIRGQAEKIIRLEEQVAALQKLDQTAVLQALKDHELGASERADRIVGAIQGLSSHLQTINVQGGAAQ